MSRPSFSVCVYCGSRAGHDEQYTRLAEVVGQWIAQHGGQLVYGGGSGGLMGAVAAATLATGGRVVGIIPKALVEKEWAKNDCTELHVVENMHDRKRMMAERADCFLALPGGIGTLEEFFEVWTWRQLGYHDKPIGLLNAGGFYDGLLGFMRHCTTQGFMGEWQSDLIRSEADPLVLLPALVQAAGLSDPVDTSEI
ncbi:TIGR00730 family Rossman fold protein [Hydrogenophaga sp. 5NK40-0174]|uniref:LOG family protein n=1 Tax=Hydrogenophaga sp. 5NK40-0174 TaxID=3127649 RepID=UPI003106135F